MLSSLTLAMPLVSLALVAAVPSRPVQPRADAAPVRTTPVAADGWRFRWKVTVETDKKDRTPASPSMSVALIPGKARMDYEGEAQPQGMMKKGGYMILDADKGTMTMVDPKEKKAVVMDPSALGNMMGAIGASGMVKMDVKDVKVSVEKLGAGDRLLGRATTKYRITRGYVMTISVFGRKNSSTHASVTEAWIADQFIEDKAFEAWAKNFTRGVGSVSGDALKKLMEAEQANQIKGIVLKQVQQSTDTDDKGNATTTTTTMEMTELAKASLDASLFEVPAGYEVTDMKAQMAGLSEEMEKAKAECEAKNGKGSEKCTMQGEAGGDSTAKVTPKDAAKKALRGLFKKP